LLELRLHGRRQEYDRRLDLFRIHSGTLPEGSRLVVEDVDVHHPVEVREGFPGFAGVGAAACRVLADAGEALDLSRIHPVDHVQNGHILAVIDLGKVGIGEVVVPGGLVAVPGFEKAQRAAG